MNKELTWEQLRKKCEELQLELKEFIDKYEPKKTYGHDDLEIKSYSMYLNFGRSGELAGVFHSESELVDILNEGNIIVYFGEVLGKHSEIYSTMNNTLKETDEFEKNTYGIDPMHCSFIDYEKIANNYKVNPGNYETVRELCIAIYESRKQK